MKTEEIEVNGKKISLVTKIDKDLIESNDIYDENDNLTTNDLMNDDYNDLEDTLVFDE